MPRASMAWNSFWKRCAHPQTACPRGATSAHRAATATARIPGAPGAGETSRCLRWAPAVVPAARRALPASPTRIRAPGYPGSRCRRPWPPDCPTACRPGRYRHRAPGGLMMARRGTKRTHRHTAADDLAEGGHVGRDAVVLGSAAPGHAKARDHFIEYQQRRRVRRVSSRSRFRNALRCRSRPWFAGTGSMMTAAMARAFARRTARDCLLHHPGAGRGLPQRMGRNARRGWPCRSRKARAAPRPADDPHDRDSSRRT